jgi:hypothetical protein
MLDQLSGPAFPSLLRGPAVLLPEFWMSLRKPYRLTPARLAANWLNAQKSTGPRTARGKEWAAMNALKNGLWAQSFRQTLASTGEPVPKFDGMVERLALVLKPCSRLQAARLVRYAQMLWSMHRRAQRFRSPLTVRKPHLQLTEAECAHQCRIMKDLVKAQYRTRWKDRRKAEPFMRLVRFVDRMAKTYNAKTKNEERSQNVL